MTRGCIISKSVMTPECKIIKRYHYSLNHDAMHYYRLTMIDCILTDAITHGIIV